MKPKPTTQVQILTSKVDSIRQCTVWNPLSMMVTLNKEQILALIEKCKEALVEIEICSTD